MNMVVKSSEDGKGFWVTAEISVHLSPEDIEDILTYALNGGISHWCKRIEIDGDSLGDSIKEHILRGGDINLYDSHTDDVYTMGLPLVLTGVKLFLEQGNHVAVDDNLLNTSDLDACDADCIIQFALFGEVVY